MKIAVACEGENATQHFGHCENFIIFNTKGKEIIDSKTVGNPGHKPGTLPLFLYEQGVNVIMTGGIGGGAIEIFNEKNIEVVTGVSGNSKEVVQNFIDGKIKSTGSVCHDHI